MHAEAVSAVVDPMGILGQVAEPLAVLGIARVADEPVGLGERRRPDEQRVDLHRQAVRHARAALDAGHRLGDVDHVLVGHDVLALGDGLLVDQPRCDAPDLLPVDLVHVDDQVPDHRHVAHRLDGDDRLPLLRVGRVPVAVSGFLEVRVARQARLSVHPHAARAADRLLARAADPDRPVLVVLDLENRVEHRLDRRQVDGVRVPVRGLARRGVVAPDLERVLGHPQYVLSSGCHRVIVTGE